jgi:hypothetical protein
MAYPIKPVCEAKDKRTNGTSIIYLQYCYAAGKRSNLNTGIAIPPNYWNKKQSIVKDHLPANFGRTESINEELTRQLRLGHFNIKTTERYLHVSKKALISIESPLDDLWRSGKVEW